MNPLRLFRAAAIAEAITWAGLLAGMVLKYGTGTTELGVRVFGMAHGVVFLAYVVTTLVVWVDQRWSLGRGLLALAAAVPPLATLPLEWWAGRRRWLAGSWRLQESGPSTGTDRVVAWLLRHPVRGLAAGSAAVLVLTGVALAVGPPTA